jgi:pimeloyl-ACP methyl ester carboxylesterase
VAERLEYFVRQRELERYVRAHQEVGPLMGVQQFDRKAVGMIAGVAEFFHFPDVRNFVTRKTVRDAIWARILKDVPQQGHLIIIGHSLGSMVVAGLLRRLPARLIVDLVVTVGSPLQFDRYRKHLPPLTTDFPYGRVRGWLNVYASGDLVTGGRGISGSIPQAFDVSAHLNGAHDLRAYMSHASVASAIGNVAFAVRDQQPTKRSGEVARALHESWRPLLLGTTFSHQLSQLLPSKEWESHLRLEAARKEVALRAVAAIEAERATRSQLIARIQKLGIPILEDELREHPLADGRHPTFEDLTVGAARILEGTWKDQELLSMAVALMLQPIVPPFDIQAELKNRTKPLVRTLNVIRRSRGNLADDAFAEQNPCFHYMGREQVRR